jgi:hypothetical protein
MRHWERVRVGLKCSYGCEIRHAEWAYMRGRFAVCEPCANRLGITRPISSTPVDARDASGLVPASSPRRGFSDMGAIAADLQAAPDAAALVNQVRRLRRKR